MSSCYFYAFPIKWLVERQQCCDYFILYQFGSLCHENLSVPDTLGGLQSSLTLRNGLLNLCLVSFIYLSCGTTFLHWACAILDSLKCFSHELSLIKVLSVPLLSAHFHFNLLQKASSCLLTALYFFLNL